MARLHPLTPVDPRSAVVRKPLAELLSRELVPMGISQGHIPAGEAFDREWRVALASQPHLLERQLTVLAWACGRLASALPPGLRHEDRIASGGAALALVDPAARALALPRQTPTCHPLYSCEHLDAIVSRLLSDPLIDAPYSSPRDGESLQLVWHNQRPDQENGVR